MSNFFNKFSSVIEGKIMPVANKVSKEVHLASLRDTFMTILPPIFFGGIIAVINSAPITENTTNKFLLAWANFAQTHSAILGWLNTVTLGFLALYVCIGLTYYLARRYKIDSLMPLVISIAGFMMLAIEPKELSFGNVLGQLTYFDGKGILVGIFVGIFTVEMYRFLTKKKFGYIKMPGSVPPALADSFGSLFTCLAILFSYSIIYILCYKFAGTSLAGVVIKVLSPALTAADNIWFALLVAFLLNFCWFFGIHDAIFSGFLHPIQYGTLSLNAAAFAAGTALPHTFTVSFWCYFGIIGGLGNCLSVAILCLLSKRQELKTVGKLGIAPAIFGISEPITFGLPIMLNPFFFIPTILTSMANVGISYLLMSTDLVGKTYAMLSYNMPSLFGSYFATGDFKAAILIVFLIILDILIYLPFFKANEHALNKADGLEK